ncbi:MAG: LysE family transporter [Defluviimonas sp.]|uniref:LysE/ArgO family amino acid transporter n=1 Tax=Albidovulum sp. TaxID=1872424 RepID=UPI001E0E1F36|nr:LysE family transporter [Paracoccaceae bacterium]MCC0065349.1 LysE family transporter [Defluviimonas sp.]
MGFAFLAGFQLSLGLITAIGAQNAFVLRQGLMRSHVFAVCLFCALSDALLIGAGVLGIGALTARVPGLLPALRWAGVAFLTYYGLRALHAAMTGAGALAAARGSAPRALAPVLATLAAITWANPHVWLDTVVLIGSVAAQFPGREPAFAAGAALASAVFFFALGYGARLLAPLFARPVAWRWLDLGVALVMFSIALHLALG